MGAERFTGTISSLYPEKNFGFIKCDETFAMFGKDVWVHGDQLGGNFQLNDPVSFSLTLGKDGKPQGIDLQRMGPALKKPAHNATVTATAAAEGHTERCIGVVKAFLPAKNFGFIECPETHLLYNKDVWVHGQQMGNFGIGDAVSFTAIVSKA